MSGRPVTSTSTRSKTAASSGTSTSANQSVSLTNSHLPRVLLIVQAGDDHGLAQISTDVKSTLDSLLQTSWLLAIVQRMEIQSL